ncbi:MAG: S-methyl-5'-thioadenosine phosphorylase [Bacteroidales bacterium]|nr:S-methyl-5'-thioadenosine phosphorylase [Bacteroidales bacterium]
MAKIGVIGGSGLEDPDILKNAKEMKVGTPFGEPASSLLVGKIENNEVVLLSRHGRKHTIPPTQVNNRANIYALKKLECTHIITTTACGSLKEEIGRGDMVIPDQFIDFTRHRKITFFEEFNEKDLKHVPMADPFDNNLREIIINSAKLLQLKHHSAGTIITIEGPRFSTRAESRMFRMWGADVINMSIAPEVILANELDIPYATIAMSTDYDSWKENEEPVSWEEVLKVFNQNVDNVIRLLLKAVSNID